MTKKKYIYSVLIVFFILHINAGALDNETLRIMPFIGSSPVKQCSACHKPKEINKFTNTVETCAPFCKKCHTDMNLHHPVGTKILETTPEGLGPLTSDQRITCITCHDLKINRFAEIRYRAESMLGSMMLKKKHYTYYLIIRNNKGQLCLKCH